MAVELDKKSMWNFGTSSWQVHRSYLGIIRIMATVLLKKVEMTLVDIRIALLSGTNKAIMTFSSEVPLFPEP